MELFTAEWFSALLSILIIDLVLAGDNAIIIGLAARNVAKSKQKPVIVLGTIGAIIIRIIATLAVAYLLKIPGLLAIGGMLLLYISFKFVTKKKEHTIEAKNSVLAAIGTIIIADATMGLDNVLAVAGAAHGDFILVITGLMISIPIVVWGSTLIIRLSDRFPWVIWVGAGVLGYTAAKMITDEPYLIDMFTSKWIKWGFILIIVLFIILAGILKSRANMIRKLGLFRFAKHSTNNNPVVEGADQIENRCNHK